MASSSSHLDPETLYPPSAVLQLRSHTPPQPFGDGWYKPPFDDDPTYRDSEIIAQSTPDDFVFSKMSRDRDPDSLIPPFAQAFFDSSAQEHGATLRITECLAVGREKGSQVVLCEVQTAPSEHWKVMGYNGFPKKVIAKIFDPLYYPTIGLFEENRDIVSYADKQYAHEAGAYIEIHGHRREHPVVDDVTPNFFGTFSITHQDHESRLRHVRVVLLEYIDGTSVFDMCDLSCPRRFSYVLEPIEQLAGGVEDRLQIFARMIHGLVALEKIGVFPRENDPRDVLVVGNRGDTRRRVVMMDFNDTRIQRYAKSSHLSMELPRPLHPAVRFCSHPFLRFTGWFPEEWLDYDSDTNSDDEEQDGWSQPCFPEWAARTFPEEDFVMGDEADEVAKRSKAARGEEDE